MNVQRYETEVHKTADKLHEHAQQTGEAAAYIVAAQWYERAGDYEAARRCREAAERLRVEE
jgi:hypothetical protein